MIKQDKYELIRIFTEFLEGKQIEYRTENDTEWKPLTTAQFDFDNLVYRIKFEKEKFDAFIYFCHAIHKWYSEDINPNINDLNLYKTFSLLFLTASIKTDDGTDLLYTFNNFMTSPYGIYESDISSNFKTIINNSSISINSECMNILLECPQIDMQLKCNIDKSIEQLKKQNKEIIKYDSVEIADIIMNWNAWRLGRYVGLVKEKNLVPISSYDIKKSNQIFTIFKKD